MTESSYSTVMESWPYRSSLDCVVEAPDGRFAAYVLVWPDDENGVGLFEPVGTRRSSDGAVSAQRYARSRSAACTRRAMRQAIVLCETPPACALYESVGSVRQGTIVGYAR